MAGKFLRKIIPYGDKTIISLEDCCAMLSRILTMVSSPEFSFEIKPPNFHLLVKQVNPILVLQ